MQSLPCSRPFGSLRFLRSGFLLLLLCSPAAWAEPAEKAIPEGIPLVRLLVQEPQFVEGQDALFTIYLSRPAESPSPRFGLVVDPQPPGYVYPGQLPSSPEDWGPISSDLRVLPGANGGLVDVEFPPGVRSGTIRIPLLDDGLLEGHEQLSLRMVSSERVFALDPAFTSASIVVQDAQNVVGSLAYIQRDPQDYYFTESGSESDREARYIVSVDGVRLGRPASAHVVMEGCNDRCEPLGGYTTLTPAVPGASLATGIFSVRAVNDNLLQERTLVSARLNSVFVGQHRVPIDWSRSRVNIILPDEERATFAIERIGSGVVTEGDVVSFRIRLGGGQTNVRYRARVRASWDAGYGDVRFIGRGGFVLPSYPYIDFWLLPEDFYAGEWILRALVVQDGVSEALENWHLRLEVPERFASGSLTTTLQVGASDPVGFSLGAFEGRDDDASRPGLQVAEDVEIVLPVIMDRASEAPVTLYPEVVLVSGSGETTTGIFDGELLGPDPLVIPPGQTRGEIRLRILQDRMAEGEDVYRAGFGTASNSSAGGVVPTQPLFSEFAILENGLEQHDFALRVASTTVVEGQIVFLYVDHRGGAIPDGQVLEVDWNVSMDSATAEDFASATSGTLSFSGSDVVKEFRVHMAADVFTESETFSIVLTPSASLTQELRDSVGGVTVIRPELHFRLVDALPANLSVAESTIRVPEGGSGEVRLRLHAGFFPYPLRIPYSILLQSASADDLTVGSGVLEGELVMPARTREVSLPFSVVQDSLVEETERIRISFGSVLDAAPVLPPSGGVDLVIEDDDSASFSLVRLDSDGFTEGAVSTSGGASTAVFEVRLAGGELPSSEGFHVDIPFEVEGCEDCSVSVSDQALETPDDRLLRYRPGEAFPLITLSAVDDGLAEPSSMKIVRLLRASPSLAVSISAEDSAEVVLQDDDALRLRVAPPAAPREGEMLRFAVSVHPDTPLAEGVSVQFSCAVSGDVSAADLEGLPEPCVGVVAGSEVAEIDFSIPDDGVLEPTMGLLFRLTSVQGVDVVDPESFANVAAFVRDASESVISLSGLGDPSSSGLGRESREVGSLSEGEALEVMIVASTPLSMPVQVSWTLEPLSEGATSGDMVLEGMTGSLDSPPAVILQPGRTEVSLSMRAVLDSAAESEESFRLSLTAVEPVSQDEDLPAGLSLSGDPSLSFALSANEPVERVLSLSGPEEVLEGQAGSFAVSLSGGGEAVQVRWRVEGNLEDFPADSREGILEVSAGSPASFEVVVLDDDLAEGDEIFRVHLSVQEEGISAGMPLPFRVPESDPVLLTLSASSDRLSPGQDLRVEARLLGGRSPEIVAVPVSLRVPSFGGFQFPVGSVLIPPLATSGVGVFSLSAEGLLAALPPGSPVELVAGSAVPSIPVDSGVIALTWSLDPGPVHVSIAAPQGDFQEGETAVFRVSLSRPVGDHVQVYWTPSTDSVNPPVSVPDLDPVPGVRRGLFIPLGSTSVEVPVELLMDEVAEGVETLSVSLDALISGPPEVSLDPAQRVASLSFRNRDHRVAVSAVWVGGPGFAESGEVAFQLFAEPRGGSYEGAVLVPWSVLSLDSSVSPEDFAGETFGEAVVFPGSVDPVRVRVSLRDDLLHEGRESFRVVFGDPLDYMRTGAAVGASPAPLDGWIAASDPLRVRVARAGDLQNLNGFIVSGESLDLSVDLGAVLPPDSGPLQLALLAEEYQLGVGYVGVRTFFLPIPAGVSAANLRIPPDLLTPLIAERSLPFRLSVSDVVGAGDAWSQEGLSPRFHLVSWVLEVPEAPDVSPEGQETSLTFRLRGSGTPSDLQLQWRFLGDGRTPASAEDFASGVLPEGVLDFSGRDSATLTFTPALDGVGEAWEGLFLNYFDPQGSDANRVALDNEEGLYFVLVDATRVVVSSPPDLPVAEGEEASFSVQMSGSGVLEEDVQVSYTLEESGASISGSEGALARESSQADVEAPLSGTLVFPAGSRLPVTLEVPVRVLEDALNEGPESLRLVLNPVGSSGVQVSPDPAEMVLAASDPMRIRLDRLDGDSEMASGEEAQFMVRFGSTLVDGVVVPVVPTMGFSVPVSVRSGSGEVVRSVSVPVEAGAAGAAFSVADMPGGDLVVSAGMPEGMPEGFMVRMEDPEVRMAASAFVLERAPVRTRLTEGDVMEIAFSLRGEGDLPSGWELPWRVAPAPGGPMVSPADFEGGVLPRGLLSLSLGENRIRIPIVEDGVEEGVMPEAFMVVFSPVHGPSSPGMLAVGSSLDVIEAQIAPLQSVLSVGDAVADEGGVLSFPLVLEVFGRMDPLSEVMVAFALSSSSAEPDVDFSMPERMRVMMQASDLSPGLSRSTAVIEVQTLSDSEVESDESLELRVVSVLGAGQVQLPGPATGTISDRQARSGQRAARASVLVSALDRSSLRMASDAVLDRVSRSAGSVEAMVAGRDLLGGSPVEAQETLGLGAGVSGGDNVRGGADLPDLASLMSGTSFSADGMGGISLWGRGAYEEVSGDSESLRYRGRNKAFLLGADRGWDSGLLTGLMWMHADGRASFEQGSSLGVGVLDRSMTSLHPYASWTTGSGMKIWTSLGFGRGRVDMEEQDRVLGGSSSASMWSYAGGLSGNLEMVPWADVRMDLSFARSRTRVSAGVFDDGDLLPSFRARSHELAGEVHASRRILVSVMEDEVMLRPYASLRAASAGVESGASLLGVGATWGVRGDWTDLGLGWEVEYGHSLSGSAHESEERFQFSVSLDPGSDGAGLGLSIGTSGGELSYGMPISRGMGVLAPYGRFGGESALGLRYELGEGALGLEGDLEGGVKLEGRLSF